MLRRFVTRGGQPRETDKLEAESGQGLAEYALILALIAVVCIGALGALGIGISTSAGFVALPAAL